MLLSAPTVLSDLIMLHVWSYCYPLLSGVKSGNRWMAPFFSFGWVPVHCVAPSTQQKWNDPHPDFLPNPLVLSNEHLRTIATRLLIGSSKCDWSCRSLVAQLHLMFEKKHQAQVPSLDMMIYLIKVSRRTTVLAL